MIILKYIYLLLFFLISSGALSQDGTIDFSFTSPIIDNNYTMVAEHVIQDDGKIIMAGSFSLPSNGPNKTLLMRMNSDGSIDPDFILGGANFSLNGTLAVAIQQDGKIIAAGDPFYDYYKKYTKAIVRLNIDGSVDTTFKFGIGPNRGVYEICIQDDGKIIIGGDFGNFNSISMNRMARLNPDGSLDPNFNIGSGFDGHVYKIMVQPDGKILVGGRFNNYNGISTSKIVRLNSDGSLDNTFNVTNLFGEFVSGIVQLNNGKYLVSGMFKYGLDNNRNGFVRLNSDGSLDPTFLSSGSSLDYEIVGDIKVVCGDKIMVSGHFNNFNNTPKRSLVRLNSNGTIDESFKGPAFDYTAGQMSIQPDGKIVICGNFLHPQRGILRIKEDYFKPTIDEILISDSCLSIPTTFTFKGSFGYDSLRWEFGDPTSGSLNSSSNFNPVHLYSTTGTYNIKVKVYSCYDPDGVDSVSKIITMNSIPVVNLGDDDVLCENESIQLLPYSTFDNYQWSNGSKNPSIVVNASGKYWLHVKNNGCNSSDTINLNFLKYPDVSLGNDLTLCNEKEYTLYSGDNNAETYLWSDKSTRPFLKISASGKYWVSVSNSDCISSDTINVIFDQSKDLSLKVNSDTIIGEGTFNFFTTGTTFS